MDWKLVMSQSGLEGNGEREALTSDLKIQQTSLSFGDCGSQA